MPLFTESERRLLALSDKLTSFQGSNRQRRVPDSQVRLTKSGKRERISGRDVESW